MYGKAAGSYTIPGAVTTPAPTDSIYGNAGNDAISAADSFDILNSVP